MNRTDRLYALVEDLRAHAPRTVRAQDMAARFEVSVRTIERDLLALQEAGVPIWAQPGPGGGYALDPLTTLPPLNLTPSEATAIAVALAANRAMPFAEAGQSALHKLVAVMSTAQRAAASTLADRVRLVDRPGPAPAPVTAAPSVRRVVEEAVVAGVTVDIDYVDRHGGVTARTVEPAGLVGGRGGWYLMAWCRLRQGTRGFRLDRIQDARLGVERIALRPLDEMIRDIPADVYRPMGPMGTAIE